MAGVAVQHLVSMNIKPGDTHHWAWTHAWSERVWWFSVDALLTDYTQQLLAPFTHKIEITRVEYRLDFPSVQNQQRQIHLWVKNNGDLEAGYDLRMAFVPSGGATLAGTSVTPYWLPPGGGSINAFYSQPSVQSFPTPRNLVAFPVLQDVVEQSDETTTRAYIESFVDGGETKTGPFLSISGTAVSEITWRLDTYDIVTNPLRVVLFFD